MRVRVRLVSLLRDAVGGRSLVEVELPGSEASLEDVLRALYEQYPSLARLVEKLRERGLEVLAVLENGREGGVKEGDTVVLLPPASGGG